MDLINRPLLNKKIILGVTGCIAAYKSAEIVRRLKKLGADVWVVMTASAQEFVTPLTFRTLSENPCIAKMFDENTVSMPMPHLALSDSADLLLVAPATANIIGKAAGGIADDALSTIIMSVECPIVMAPAMNTKMWKNAAVQENVKKLRKLGSIFIGPEKGELACGDIGEGRLANTDDIIKAVVDKIGIKQDLAGKKLLITAGGTREAIDPVRFIGNRSSGKMGFAIAEAARNRGADVVLISANANIKAPDGIELVNVQNARQMKDEVSRHFKDSDILVMSAAVSDFTPQKASSEKIKKGKENVNIGLKPTDDILLSVSKQKEGKVIVGFSVESRDLLKNSKDKLRSKDLDMIVANDVSAFEDDSSKVTIIKRSGKSIDLPRLPKSKSAEKILDEIALSSKH
ncbi:MAG: bifunctional phosphopantothenoylcysteine decarboxylase/phosphopantothenate--cysteine ligase CoaBC [Candidatus Saganbacteria bacterium]|nr:bifunctional phosphopantothenoylcysteine decarboxylase/phosphopantothenate--cysteine ligase CoaBC [Candidatus Saganbacteria bacterium]